MTRKKRFQLDDPTLLSIGELADNLGLRAYVVGGYVRDLSLGGKSKDIDVMVLGDPIFFAREVGRKLNATGLVVFERFRTAQMMIGEVKVEIVGARKESYERGSRKPQVEEASLEEDLSRRDFTINAMAISIVKTQDAVSRQEFGELIDPFGGQQALAKGIIDTPLEPEETFSEDPLRILSCNPFRLSFRFYIAFSCQRCHCENEGSAEHSFAGKNYR